MLATISSANLAEWRAYDKLEPFGEERAALHFALVCTVMANMWRGQNSDPVSIDDFILKFRVPEVEDEEPDYSIGLTDAELSKISAMRAAFQALGNKVVMVDKGAPIETEIQRTRRLERERLEALQGQLVDPFGNPISSGN